ncbi:MAG: Clp protease ClpP [Janthinobacterium lividum]
MTDLVIKIREYIGESSWNWYTDEYEWATNCDDLRMAVEYAGYAGQEFDRVVLEIGNCYGGSVYEGMAMFHYLQELGVPVLARVLGTVASMGTVLVLAADEIEAAQTAQWMVHAPSDEFWGTASQVAADLKGLQDLQAILSEVYVARTGQDAATVATWLTQDTWFRAAEALAVGLCTSVTPLRPKSAPAPATTTDAQAKLHRKRFAEAVARADTRTSPTAKPAAAAAPIVMPDVKKPITAAVKPTPRAAAPAAKPAVKAAQPTARKTLFQQLKDLFNDASDEELAEDTTAEAVAATVESTELDNGAFLYHDGALAQGSLVFNDEAMTEATGDGDYDTADAQVVSVAAGAVTAIAASADATAAAAPAAESAAVAALRKEFETMKGKLATAEAELNTLKKIKPPMPTARAARPNADAPDPKAGLSVKQPVEGAGTL